MKAIPIIIILIIGILVTGYGSLYYLSTSSQELLKLVEKIDEPLESDDWTKAEKATKDFLTHWEKQKDIWLLIIDHKEIDQIEEGISKLKAYIQAKEKGLAKGELVSIKHLVHHIPLKEALNLKNVL